MLVELGTIASVQSKGTETTNQAVTQLIKYAVTNPDANIHYISSDVYLNIHSDSSYLSEAQAHSRAGGDFFLSLKPADPTNTPDPNTMFPPHKGAIHIVINVMRNIPAYATEAELAALFDNARYGVPLRTTLIEMGHPQGPTSIQT
jgi:hypothetical protein